MATDTAGSTSSILNLFGQVPGLRQLLMLLGLAAAVAAGIALFLWARGENYGVLYAGLSDRDAAEVSQALTAANIPYRLEAGGLLVAEPRLHEARMKLASLGLPAGGGLGLEVLRQESGLGVSSFVENARYQHALETELSRTVASLRPVQNARVHLAVPKPSAFTRTDSLASASVLVELYPGRALEPDQVSAIVHLVASSIPNLEPRRVTVLDQQGRLLSRPESGSEDDTTLADFQKTRNVEQNLSRRIEQLLLPMTGPGRVSVQVSADLDFASTEEVHESYQPDPQAVRSETTSAQSNRDSSPLVAGVPGAASNQPARAGGNAAAAGSATTGVTGNVLNESKTSTRNFELDRTIRHTRNPGGRVRRITVAVLVDHLPKTDAEGKTSLSPLNESELKQVESIVREVVGFNAERGDSVSVMNTEFRTVAAEALEPQPLWEKPWVKEAARQVLGVGLLLFLILMVVKPALRNLTQIPVAVASTSGIADLRDDRAALSAAALSEATGLPNRTQGYEQKLQVARNLVGQDPKRVAQVVRTWVGGTDG